MLPFLHCGSVYQVVHAATSNVSSYDEVERIKIRNKNSNCSIGRPIQSLTILHNFSELPNEQGRNLRNE